MIDLLRSEEVEKGEEVEQVIRATILVNLLVMDPVLIIQDEEGPTDAELLLIPLALRNEVDNSFVGGEGIDSNSEVDMPLKAKNLGEALAPEKSKAVHSPIIQDSIPIQVLALFLLQLW